VKALGDSTVPKKDRKAADGTRFVMRDVLKRLAKLKWSQMTRGLFKYISGGQAVPSGEQKLDAYMDEVHADFIKRHVHAFARMPEIRGRYSRFIAVTLVGAGNRVQGVCDEFAP
jgi:hypothetical protein